MAKSLKKHIETFTVFTGYFLFSLIMSGYYIYGDQEHYRAFYEGITSYELIDGYSYYLNTLGAKEPIYYLITWLSAPLIEKDLLFSLLNAFLATSIYTWLRAKESHWLVILTLAFNFYLMVLMFAAERLKVSMLFFFLMLNSKNGSQLSYALMSILSHFQLMILLASTLTKRFFDYLVEVTAGKFKEFHFLLTTITILGIFALALYLNIISIFSYKIEHYIQHGGLYSMGKPLVFLLASIYYAKQMRVSAAFSHLPVLIAAFFFGSERVVVFSYVLFIYYSLQSNRGLNFGMLISGIYFLFKGVVFLNDVYSTGTGFEVVT